MNSTEERYSKLRRQKINVMLNEEERKIITEKAIKYGFGDCLAEYIRAACIYENIYIEDVQGKQELCEIVSRFIARHINNSIMFTTQFWLIVIGIAQMIGCSWIFSKFQKRTYKREIRSRHSYVLLAKLLAEEENLDATSVNAMRMVQEKCILACRKG